ncbi:MAG TPA: hypothetical protein DCE14_03555 [Kosmotogaceae bacterium]|nr:MAG: hypothetical protein XE05_1724 [Thermotogales bacterium 46_20]HAA85410.1 hypothetical protein [Kosmotogaceae bacterium]
MTERSGTAKSTVKQVDEEHVRKLSVKEHHARLKTKTRSEAEGPEARPDADAQDQDRGVMKNNNCARKLKVRQFGKSSSNLL